MKNKIQKIMVTAFAFSFLFCAGCAQGTDVEDANKQQTVTEAPEVTEAPADTAETPTEAPVATEAPTDTTEAPTEVPEVTESPADTTETPTEAPEITEAPAADTTETPTEAPEVTETPAETTETPTEVPEITEAPAETTETPAEAPEVTEAPVPTATPAPTEAPKATEAPTSFVKTEGKVDKALLVKVENVFAASVKEMKDAGLISKDEACITITGGDIYSRGHSLTKDGEGYILTVQSDYLWAEGMCPLINGVDPAPYNKKMLVAMLDVISDDATALFNRIDEDCFSANSLSGTEWETVGDCYIKGDAFTGDSISYNIVPKRNAKDVTKYEKQYNRDASYVLKGTRSDGSPIEVVIEYDSSLVGYELTENEDMGWIVNGRPLPTGTVTYMYALDEEKWGPYGYPEIRTGSVSCEAYQKDWLDSYIAKGALNPSIYDLENTTVNGYTYYYFEGMFMTETEIGDPDILYVQIGANEYIEFYDLMFEGTLEEFVSTCLYIKEVR